MDDHQFMQVSQTLRNANSLCARMKELQILINND
jgi:hypothetical protein